MHAIGGSISLSQGFGIALKKLWLTVVVKFVLKDAAEADPFSGNGTLTASSASCAEIAVAVVQFECLKHYMCEVGDLRGVGVITGIFLY